MAVKKSKAAEIAPAAASEPLKKPKSKPKAAKPAEAAPAPEPTPEPAPAPVVVAEAPAKKAAKPKAKAAAEPAPAPPPAPTPAPKVVAEVKAVKPAKAAAPVIKVTDKQKEFLKTISADSAGYLTTKKAEQKSLESLLEKKLIKKGAKDKASGVYRYVISKAGEKLITS